MSFRTRLTLFFVLIVIVPMIALGVVVARLVTDSEQGKVHARAGAYSSAAMSIWERAAQQGARGAALLGSDPALAAAIRGGDRAAATTRARLLARQRGFTRVLIVRPAGTAGAAATGRAANGTPRPFVDIGSTFAVAAGSARVRSRTGEGRLADVEVSTIDAREYVSAARGPGVEVAVRRDGEVLASSLPAVFATDPPPPLRGDVTRGGTDYVAAGFRAGDFDGSADTVALLADASRTAAAVAGNRRLAVALLAGFLLLALAGAVLVSRQLQAQIARFLAAAKRVGGGDFSTRVPVEGGDEFAELGQEFNKMSGELEQRIDDLRRERGRLRDSIQRVGETFASNLDRRALLEIGTETAVEAVEASCGRSTLDMPNDADPSTVRVGDLAGLEPALVAAERRARATGAPIEATAGDAHALASPIPRAREGAGPHGVVAVARAGRPFGDEERALLGSLAAQTGISLENVELHDQVKRQAVTDELTGLFNHRRFQEVIAIEVAAAQRFGQPLGLLMIDIDDFKQVNDGYGHQQGDIVLRAVAQILRDNSREIDEPARYGGEEMAVALPQTDLDGAFTIAERVRTAVEALVVRRLDGGGDLHVTVSCGVAASSSKEKDALVAAADVALYTAKRTGKNRTVRAAEGAATESIGHVPPLDG